jgi:hypothetical protein
MYFKSFPLTMYSLDDLKTAQAIPDITRRVGFIQEFISNNSNYDLYDIKDGETPEIISDIFYGTTLFHWIILHANDIVDPRFEWPLSQENLKNYCIQKYGGETEIYKTKLYVNTDSYVVNNYRALEESSFTGSKDEVFFTFENGATLLLRDPPTPLTAISRLEYEIAINESKRRIKVPKTTIIPLIQTNFINQIVR